MKWYKKQLAEKLKKDSSNKIKKESFGAGSIKSSKNIFANPVAAMNRNRKKTDLF